MRVPDINMPAVRQELINMTGGVNEAGTQLQLKSGELITALNYMEVDGPSQGYTSLEGYERYDGGLRLSTGVIDTVNGTYTLPTDIALGVMPDDGINNPATVFLLESDGTLTFDEQINGITLTATSVTEPTTSPFLYGKTTSFYMNGAGGIRYEDTTNIFDFSTDDFTIELFFKASATVDTTVDSYLLSKSTVFGLWWDSDATNAYLRFDVIDSALTTHSKTTNITLQANKEYHIVLSCRTGVVRLLVNGEPAYSGFTIASATPVGGMNTASTFFSIGCKHDNTLPIKGWFDEVRVEIGSGKYFSSYDVPIYPFSDGNFYQINYDDSARETFRSAIQIIPGATDGPNGVTYYSGDRNAYVLNDKDDGSGKASLWRTSTAGFVLVDDTFNEGGSLDAVEWRIDGYSGNDLLLIMVDGKSYPRFWDGTSITLINDAAIVDEFTSYGLYPSYVTVWANRLVLGYTNGRILMSASDDPTDISGGYGALLNWGDSITGFAEGPDDTLVVFMRNSIKVCYSTVEGSSDFNFQAKTFSRSSGAIAGTIQRALEDIVFSDDRGIMTFGATDKFGDFSAANITKNVNEFFNAKKGLITTTRIGKNTNQYRLYFSDGYFLIYSFNRDGSFKGATTCKYPRAVKHVVVGEDASGNLVKFFTSNTNYLYKMDSGTTFDGEAIERYIQTGYYSYKSPGVWKRFRKFVPEIKSTDPILNFKVDFSCDYADGFIEKTTEDALWTITSLASWGVGKWGTFVWSSQSIAHRAFYTFSKTGTNMSIKMWHKSKYTKQHVILNALVYYSLNNRRR